MSEEPTLHELAKLCAVLEERMNTKMAENETLKADLAATLSGMRADMATHREDAAKDAAKRDAEAAKRDAEAAKRDKDNQRWVVGFGIAQMVLTVTVLAAGFAFLG
ncbi:MAG: hypothetical protein OXC53_03465, partial [Rhodobacteraceae bacterium]|nr:hypothetical protein [Paracoccaceae bacterium]